MKVVRKGLENHAEILTLLLTSLGNELVSTLCMGLGIVISFCDFWLCICFLSGIDGCTYTYAEQPPLGQDLSCDPYENGLRLSCAVIARSFSTDQSFSIQWYHQGDTESEIELLEGAESALNVSATSDGQVYGHRRSTLQIDSSDVSGGQRYWCQVIADRNLQRSNILDILPRDYYRNADFSGCPDDVDQSILESTCADKISPTTIQASQQTSQQAAIPHETAEPPPATDNSSNRLYVYILAGMIGALCVLFIFLVPIVVMQYKKVDRMREKRGSGEFSILK